MLSNNNDPFLIKARVSFLLPFCVFPFSFPPGGVAFTASNYRLYLSHISPYISADLSRPLQGQLIALWQACARPLKEKSRSGWSNSILCSSSKHLHIRLPPSLSVCAILLSFLSLYVSLLYPPRDPSHNCVIALVISLNKEEQNIFLSTSSLSLCT